MRALFSITALLAVVAATSGGPAAAEAFRPDPAVQVQVDRVVDAIAAANRGGNRSGLHDRIERLEQASAGRENLLLEVAWQISRAKSAEKKMSAALLLDHLNFTDSERIGAIVGELESAAGPWRDTLSELLATVDRPRGGDPDFSIYEPFLGDDSTVPPVGLVHYMYDVSPGEALSTMVRALLRVGDLRGAIESAADTVESARQDDVPSASTLGEANGQLDLLSRSDVWWVRLYAAATIRDEPRLAAAETTARLRDDDHPLVRLFAGF